MHEDLLQSAQTRMEMIEKAKVLLAQYTEEKEDKILQYNNELAQLQTRFDQAHSDVLIWVRKPGRAGGHSYDLAAKTS
uniref:Uncharacterized protein n=1 Tax=Nothoprocta perdicaria TaxID=30464 RepID=A0A8C6ZZK7_NOTPE